MTTRTTKNQNEAQAAYAAAKQEARKLLRQIERAISDTPAACNGNWGMVGDLNKLINDLREAKSQYCGDER